jgi:SAM-dependent methyltransferase
MSSTEPYLLGISDAELERMRFQHGVWKASTDDFLNRLGVGPGMRCLDVGAGPGFVTVDLRERVGATGHVTALEPSKMYLDHLHRIVRERGWSNVDAVLGTAETASLPEASYDLVYVRWVVNFVADRAAFLRSLARWVKPGGLIALEDYFYEGLGVHPRGTDFDRMPDIVRRYYRSGGGEAYAIAEVPSILRNEGFGLVVFTPQQQVGGKDSPVFQWASRFFRLHLPIMAERGIIDVAERDRQMANLERLAQDPEMFFFSPIVVQCAMRRQGKR